MDPTFDPSQLAIVVDPRRLQAFLLAARAKSFAIAAQHLHLVPSAVSHAIKGLEEELDCTLFLRQGPRVVLTREGLRLLPFAEKILSNMEALRTEVQLMRGHKDQLSVIVPETICSRLLPTLLPDFQESFPGVRLKIIAGCFATDITQHLHDLKADIILTTSASAQDEDLVRRDVFQEEIALYTAPFHPMAAQRPAKKDRLESCLILSSETEVGSLIEQRWFNGTRSADQAWVLESVSSVCGLAMAGWGIAALADWVAQPHVDRGELRRLPVQRPSLHRTWAALWPGGIKPSWAAEVFLGLLEMAGRGARPHEA